MRCGSAGAHVGVEFTLRSGQTGMVLAAPILPALAAAPTFIAPERGQPFTKDFE